MKKKYNGRHKWSDAEIQYLKDNYANNLTDDIAAKLNLTNGQVSYKAQLLCLHKNPEWVRENSRKNISKADHPIHKTKFKKGHKTWNKGMKGVCFSGCEKTWFKKGHKPHNTKFDGYTRVGRDNYIEVRVAEGKFIGLHRKIYEDHHGPVPSDSIVIFKDGNKRNFDINNLEMITKAENARRNSYHDLPEDVKAIINAKKSLTRVINTQIKRAQ